MGVSVVTVGCVTTVTGAGVPRRLVSRLAFKLGAGILVAVRAAWCVQGPK